MPEGKENIRRYDAAATTTGGNRLVVVGAGSGYPGHLTPEAREAISGSRYIAAGMKLLDLAARLAPHAETFAIGPDMDAAISYVTARLGDGDVCVLTSGDPGCFSILPLFRERFGDALIVLPGISSVQVLAARLALPWQDWRLVSLHGRGAQDLEPPASATVFFCDPDNSPQTVAGRLLAAAPDCAAAVGAFLGREGERVISGRLSDVARGEFPGHSLLLVMPSDNVRGPAGGAGDSAPPGGGSPGDAPPVGKGGKRRPSQAGTGPDAAAPGIPDGLWMRRDGIPLAKSEVRAVLMSKARPAGRRVIWDIGAGTGSYGIECSLLEPRALVIAVDKNPAACHLVAANAERFGARVEVVCAEAPEGFETLAPPDLVIIGGNEGMLKPIFKSALNALEPGGRIAVTALLEETRRTAHGLFAESGLVNRTATRVTIARGEGHEWVEHNPVIIFTGDRL